MEPPVPPAAAAASAETPPSSSLSHLHQDDADEEDENVKQLKDCSFLYLALQDCLIEKDRNWKACQPEVQALKSCNERRMNKDGKK